MNNDQNKKINIISLYKKIYTYLWKTNKNHVLISLFFFLIFAINSYLGLKFIEIITNIAYKIYDNPNVNFIEEIMPLIWLIIFFIAERIASALSEVASHHFNMKADLVIKKDIYAKMAYTTWENLESQDLYNRMDKVKGQATDSMLNMYQSSLDLFSNLIYLAMSIYLLSKISIYVNLGILISLFLTALITFKLIQRVITIYREDGINTKKMGYYMSFGHDHKSHQEYQSNRLYKYVFNRWNDRFTYRVTHLRKTALIDSGLGFFGSSLSLIVYLVALYMVALEIVKGNQDIGYFMMISFMLLSYLQRSFGMIFSIFHLTESIETMDNFFLIMDLNNEQRIDTTRKTISPFDIQFSNVRYSYPLTTKDVLKGINITFKAGEKVAIVGHNGCGKTTLTNLLMGLTDKFEGEILVDGKPQSENFSLLRNSTSFILQDFIQYQMTIRENIQMGNIHHEFTDQEIQELVQKAGLTEFVSELENGIDTKLGQLDKGVELSKGQWQRVAIARLLANPDAKVWVLDEPTAYLDPIAEIDMYNFIYDLAKDRTVLFISHRLGFAKRADRIIVMEDGQIIEKGTHQELRKAKGLYHTMYENQKGWYE